MSGLGDGSAATTSFGSQRGASSGSITINKDELETMLQKIISEVAKTNQGGPTYPVADPGTANAPCFKGQNITQYLRVWEDRCSDWRWNDERKVKRFSQYADKTIPWMEHLLESLPGYKENDWKTYKAQLLIRFADYDEKLYTKSRLETLCKLYSDRPDAEGLEHFVSEFKEISTRLVKNKLIMQYEQICMFTDALPEAMLLALTNKTKNLAEALLAEDGILFSMHEDDFTIEKLSDKLLEKSAAQKLIERKKGKEKLALDRPIHLPKLSMGKLATTEVKAPEFKPTSILKKDPVDFTTIQSRQRQPDTSHLEKMMQNLVLKVDSLADSVKQQKGRPRRDSLTNTNERNPEYDRPPDKRCRGCGEEGHWLRGPEPGRVCFKIGNLIGKGLVKFSDGERPLLEDMNGNIIRSRAGRWLCEEVEFLVKEGKIKATNPDIRLYQATVELVTESDNSETEESAEEIESDEDSSILSTEEEEFESSASSADEDTDSETDFGTGKMRVLDSLGIEERLQKRYCKTLAKIDKDRREDESKTRAIDAEDNKVADIIAEVLEVMKRKKDSSGDEKPERKKTKERPVTDKRPALFS